MNPVLILTRNCLELTKRCVESVKAQDIATDICVMDNGSTDGTVDWLYGEFAQLGSVYTWDCNKGVSYGWNAGLSIAFGQWNKGTEHVLVINNDVILPPNFLRDLLSLNLPFVTGASVSTMDAIGNGPCEHPYPSPDFSAFLIRRDCWEAVGPFDENMVNYCSDCDYHVRAHRLGIKLLNASVHFYHERSSTLKHAKLDDQIAISQQADRDRAAFWLKYGCMPWEPAYKNLFLDQSIAKE